MDKKCSEFNTCFMCKLLYFQVCSCYGSIQRKLDGFKHVIICNLQDVFTSVWHECKVSEVLPPEWLRWVWRSAHLSARPAAAWELSSAPPARGAPSQTAAPAPVKKYNQRNTHICQNKWTIKAKEHQRGA